MLVLGIAEARSTLSSIVDALADETSGGIVIGSHRKPTAAIVPYSVFAKINAAPQRPLLYRIREKRELILRLASMSRITAVSVFGSVARGEERGDSDIDLLVESEPGASLFDLARFELDMEALFDRHVDAIDRGALDPARDRAMLAEAVPL